jgi:hypothetical protein
VRQLNVIAIDINRVFNVDADAELVHQLLRGQIDGARTEHAQGRLFAVPQHAGELLPLCR